MAGIVAALEAHDDVGLLRQPVDDLALPFVAPLGADDDDIGHFESIPLQLSQYEHDLVGKTGPTLGFSGSCAQPKSRPGAARMRGPHRITEAGYRRKQEGAFGRNPDEVQALDIPRKFLSEPGRQHSAAGRSGATVTVRDRTNLTGSTRHV